MHFVSLLTTATASKQSKFHLVLLFNLILSGILLFSTYLLWLYQSAWLAIPILGLVALLLYAHFIWQQQRYFQIRQQHSQQQQQQYELMLHTINSGLFLLNEQFQLSQQHSQFLNILLQQKHLGGENLIDVLRPHIHKSEINIVQRFLQQLFDASLPDSLLQELNPLSHIDLHFTDTHQQNNHRSLNFQFTRIYDQHQVTYILVNINDVSHHVTNQNASQTHDLQNHFLLSIIKSDLPVIENIMLHLQTHNQALSALISQEHEHTDAYKLMLPNLSVHTQALQKLAANHDLNIISNLVDEFDGHIVQLKQQSYLNHTDLQPLNNITQQLLSIHKTITQVYYQLKPAHANAYTTISTASLLTPDVDFYADEDDCIKIWQGDLAVLAQKHGKDIRLLAAASFQNLPLQLTYKLQDWTWYLIQYATIYGIESPLERELKNKPTQGTVTVSLTETEHHHILKIEDDGQGIDFSKITWHAMDLGWLSDSQPIQPHHDQLLHYLFEPEFSDLSSISETTSDNMGLYGLRQWLDEKGGNVHIETEAHHHTRFVINLPKA